MNVLLPDLCNVFGSTDKLEVSASNAGKMLFLCEAALDFLLYTGKGDGNEQDIL